MECFQYFSNFHYTVDSVCLLFSVPLLLSDITSLVLLSVILRTVVFKCTKALLSISGSHPKGKLLSAVIDLLL